MNEYIENVCLNLDYYSGKDEYSDGEIEDVLLDIVKNNTPEDYNRIIKESRSWPILYHLSEQRTNILGVVPFTGTESVLEIGSGCGAITGALAENVRKVTCIELSKKRSLINAYRNRKKDNIEILVGNFQIIDKNIKEQYDYIMLIGVLEYAQYYIESGKPYQEFIKMIKRHLKPEGKIVIAIENKYGMKYWAGCREDHINTFFGGIEGYVGNNRARTFSKNKLEELLLISGLKHVEFYYPYPDYKFPSVIYSDDCLPQKGQLVNNMRNYDNNRLYLFSEEKAFDSVIDDESFPMFSNSFLVICD